MKRILFLILALPLLAVSCDIPFPGGASAAKVGIVKTSNGGVDWQGANKIKDTDQTLLNLSISQMKFNGLSDLIYASSYNGGLYSSDDAAENWKEVLGGVTIYDFVLNPDDENTIYAAAYLGDRGRVLHTSDGGKSWNEVYSDAGTKNAVRAITLDPNDPQSIYIGTDKGLLIHSSDGGLTWQLRQTFTGRINSVVYTDQGMYIVVKTKGVYLSTNSGRDVELLTGKVRVVANQGVTGLTSNSKPSDFRQLVADPVDSQFLLLSTNLGLFKTEDGGRNWNYVSMPYRRQDASPFAIAFAPSSDDVIYVSSNSVILKSLDRGRNWTSSDTGTNGLVSVILVSPDLPQLAFAGVSK